MSRSTVEGADFIQKGIPVSLKGPISINSATGELISVSDDMVNGLISSVVKDANRNTLTKKVIVDLYKLTDSQQTRVMEEIYNQVPNPGKDIIFIR